ncbi:hypothetical protein [Kitasatospora sp. NPDC090308]|uniref:hypothetical protein n=1 Tax=Kitasatospora sp. NPDC090308 TaxID=3364082 RepID=UPI00382AE214
MPGTNRTKAARVRIRYTGETREAAEAGARGDLRVGRGGSVGGRRVNERFATVVLDF